MIDLTTADETVQLLPKSIEVIDLTQNHIILSNVDPERLADFRHRVVSAFVKAKKTTAMSLLRLARRVNWDNTAKFSKMEIDSALQQMVNDDEIFISNGLVFLVDAKL